MPAISHGGLTTCVRLTGIEAVAHTRRYSKSALRWGWVSVKSAHTQTCARSKAFRSGGFAFPFLSQGCKSLSDSQKEIVRSPASQSLDARTRTPASRSEERRVGKECRSRW